MSAPHSIHHINILIKDLEPSVVLFEKLLKQTAIREELSGRAVSTARFKIGDAFLVLVSPHSEDSTVGKLLLEKGEGLFLLSLGVDDLAQSIDQLAHAQLPLTIGEKREGVDGWPIQDIELSNNLGFILQLTQSKISK